MENRHKNPQSHVRMKSHRAHRNTERRSQNVIKRDYKVKWGKGSKGANLRLCTLHKLCPCLPYCQVAGSGESM